MQDVSLIYEEVHFNGRSILPSSPSGFLPVLSHPVCNRPALVRWNFSQPVSVENCVVMEVKQADAHQRAFTEGKSLDELYGPEVVKGVGEVMKEARRALVWRESRVE